MSGFDLPDRQPDEVQGADALDSRSLLGRSNHGLTTRRRARLARWARWGQEQWPNHWAKLGAQALAGVVGFGAAAPTAYAKEGAPEAAIAQLIAIASSIERGARTFPIDQDLITARRCDPGSACTYQWTLAARLGEALSLAEQLFGPRDPRYTLLGVEFTTDPQPSIWLPSFGNSQSSSKFVTVLLTREAAVDERIALFQLGHEVIHILSPVPGRDVSHLEEGLATWFQLHYLSTIGRPGLRAMIGNAKYNAALADVERLFEIHRDGPARLKALRATGAGLSRLTAAKLARFFPEAPLSLLHRLAGPFGGPSPTRGTLQ